MKTDKEFMLQAIELAKKGSGFVNPNPLVGCVITKDNKVISTGYHKKFGSPHSEVNAINSAKCDLEGTTMYVTLEPCSHYGKTPPCTDLIIKHKISKVFVAMLDPNPLVSGRGIQKLRDNGIDVVVGVCEDEAKELNEIFIKYITTKKPFVLIKSATSLDGKTATKTKDSKWISNEISREYTHNLRQKYSSILVGINTVFADDPSLTTRLDGINVSHPTRIIIDSNLRIPTTSKVLTDGIGDTIIYTTIKESKKRDELLSLGATLITTPKVDNKVDLNFVFNNIGERGIDSVLIEGGGTINDSCFRLNLVDKLALFISPQIIGGKDAPSFVGGIGIEKLSDSTKLEVTNISTLGNDILVMAKPKRRNC